jgi:hypothetical protein
VPLSQVKLAKALGLSRSTVQYYLAAGMPAELRKAQRWLIDWKENKANPVAVPIQSTPANGDTFEDRLSRLRTSEKAIAGEIEAATATQLGLVTLLINSDEKQKPNVEKQLAVVNQRLIALRKQHMSITKILCDLELKKTSLSKDLVDIATVHDAFVRLNMRFAQYVRHFADDTEPREVKDCYRTITNIIAGELNKMVRDLITELRNPSKEHEL